MARALGGGRGVRARGRVGRAWGNALGGFRRQKRDAAGRFAGGGMRLGGAGRPTRAPKASKASKASRAPKTSGLKSPLAAVNGLVGAQGAQNKVKKGSEWQGKRNPLAKNPSTSFRHAENRSQEAFKSGKLSRQAGVIPYTRHSFSSHSAGVNAGVRILPNYRLSGGAYLKIQNIDKTRREKQLRKQDEQIVLGLVQKVSPHPTMDRFFGAAIKKIRRNQIDKLVGGETRVGKKSWARVTTDKNAMPTLTVEYNRSEKRTKRRKKGRERRREAIWAYNDMVTKNRGYHVKPPRPQRRGAAS